MICLATARLTLGSLVGKRRPRLFSRWAAHVLSDKPIGSGIANNASSIDHEGLTSHVGGKVRPTEQHGARDVIWIGPTTERNV